MAWELHRMDCRLAMLMLMDSDSIESCVTDPPYGLSKEPDTAEVLRHWLNGDDYVHGHAGFMNRDWDAFVPGPAVWREVYRVLKPGASLLSFFGTRTYDLGCMAIRLAGFEIRDELCWLYGSGFPKSLDVSKAIDKAAGAEREILAERPAFGIGGNGTLGGHAEGATFKTDAGPATIEAAQWQGWGTALKPAHEPIVLARKPLAKGCTVAQNVLTHGTGGLHIDACRVASEQRPDRAGGMARKGSPVFGQSSVLAEREGDTTLGRFPANVLHDGSDEVLAMFPDLGKSNSLPRHNNDHKSVAKGADKAHVTYGHADSGSAARFFPSCPLDDEDVATARAMYCAKASRADRNEGCEAFPKQMPSNAIDRASQRQGLEGATGRGSLSKPRANHHPTVKPTALMRWLVRLVTPPGGTVLDPFTGSGSTGKAALLEGFNFVGCEMTDEYADIAEARLVDAVRRVAAPG